MEFNELKKYKYISFDIYDTLLKRNVENPSDVFDIVENEYNKKTNSNISNFKQIRLQSEKKCRNSNDKEISLKMIYDEIALVFNSDVANKLMQIEEDVEYNIIQKNYDPDVCKMYDWAIKNKKVIIISDMYLSEKLIKKILKKCNISYDKLYLSSKIGEKKSSSKLFKYVLNDLGINHTDIFHIGDNHNSDFIMCKKCSIDSKLISTKINNLYFKNKKINKLIDHNLSYNILFNFINNNINKCDNILGQFGYQALGPILISFCFWLKDRLKDDGIDNVYFLARDGKIIKEAFDKIDFQNDFKKYYLMASRRSIIVPSLSTVKDKSEIFKRINIPQKLTLYDFKKRLGLDDININSILKKYEIDENTKYDFKKILQEDDMVFDEIFNLVIKNSKEENQFLNNYLKMMGFNNKVAIVDIGWFGNMQVALTSVCNADIHGYYFGMRPKKKNNITSEGFLFDINKNLDLYELEDSFNAIFEFIFSASHGSVKKFTEKDPYVELYDNKSMSEYEIDSLMKIQRGAINFIEDILNSNILSYVEINERISSINIFELLTNPSYELSRTIGNVLFEDGSLKYIAKSKGLKFYFKSPKTFVKDLKDCYWKIGFLKYTFKINLPYYSLFKFIKKIV